MIQDHQKIEIKERVVYETILCDQETTFHFSLNDEAYFIYVHQGKHVALSPNEIIEVPEGNLGLVVGKSLVLKAYPNPERQQYQVLIIHLNRAVVTKALESKFPNQTRSSSQEFSRDMFTGKACIISQNYVDGIFQYFYNQAILSEDLLDLKIREILLLLLSSKKVEEITLLLKHFVNKRTSSFKEVIEKHVFSKISLQELSQLCNMSLSTFKRHFKNIYQASPKEYFYAKRLENSSKLLLTSEYSISQIAVICGFKTTAHFSKKFKEKFGVPPSRYKMSFPGK